jgi:hypothetical protein
MFTLRTLSVLCVALTLVPYVFSVFVTIYTPRTQQRNAAVYIDLHCTMRCWIPILVVIFVTVITYLLTRIYLPTSKMHNALPMAISNWVRKELTFMYAFAHRLRHSVPFDHASSSLFCIPQLTSVLLWSLVWCIDKCACHAFSHEFCPMLSLPTSFMCIMIYVRHTYYSVIHMNEPFRFACFSHGESWRRVRICSYSFPLRCRVRMAYSLEAFLQFSYRIYQFIRLETSRLRVDSYRALKTTRKLHKSDTPLSWMCVTFFNR